MDLMPTADQDAIRDSVRSFLDAELPMSRVRALCGAAGDAYAPLWGAAAELGLFADYALTEQMVLFEELGRALAPGPWLGSVLAASALAAAGHASATAVSAGETRVALCLDPLGGALALRGDRLTGARRAVLGAGLADALHVVDDAGVQFVPRESGVAVDAPASLDATNPVGTVTFTDAPVARLAADPAYLRRAAIVLACAEAVGGIARTGELSVEYAKVRKQFDKPIGSFQAVKHRCADMAVRAEVARSATTYTAVSVRDAAADADFQVAVAKVLCANAYLQNAADNVQNHGGMGFTWECDAHLFVKRSRAFDATIGPRRAQMDALVAQFRAA
jgi:alkylation response protein AidB-like acyl-CoA dehydrogenase